LIVDSKFLSRTLSLVISDMLYHLSNAVQQFLELWILDDIMDVVAFLMEDVEARVEATIVVGVGTSEAEASVAMS